MPILSILRWSWFSKVLLMLTHEQSSKYVWGLFRRVCLTSMLFPLLSRSFSKMRVMFTEVIWGCCRGLEKDPDLVTYSWIHQLKVGVVYGHRFFVCLQQRVKGTKHSQFERTIKYVADMSQMNAAMAGILQGGKWWGKIHILNFIGIFKAKRKATAPRKTNLKCVSQLPSLAILLLRINAQNSGWSAIILQKPFVSWKAKENQICSVVYVQNIISPLYSRDDPAKVKHLPILKITGILKCLAWHVSWPFLLEHV